MGVSALNITLKYYEGGVKLKVKSRNCPGHCKAPKQRDKMEIPSDLSIKSCLSPTHLFLFPLVCYSSVKIYAVKVAVALVLTLTA